MCFLQQIMAEIILEYSNLRLKKVSFTKGRLHILGEDYLF